MRTRVAAAVLAFALCTLAVADVRKAANDDALLENAGVHLADVQFRLPCRAAIVQTAAPPDPPDPPEFFHCVYVQTQTDLEVFSLEGDVLISDLQLKLHNIEGVAVASNGALRQLQVFYRGDHVLVLQVLGAHKLFVSPGKAEAIRDWLVGRGVKGRSPRPWIDPRTGLLNGGT